MKKLFLFLALTALLSSCSSDDNGILEAPVNKETKHKISFDIKSDGFSIDKTPLKALTSENTLLQVVVYKESGEVYSDTVMLSEKIKNIISEDGLLPFSLELPTGNYHLAFLHTFYRSTNPNNDPRKNDVIQAQNFFTDKYGGINSITGSDANINNYYETIDISVSDTQKEQTIAVELAPMWSTVSITIEDSKTFKIPLGVNFVMIDLEPSYLNFSIETKLAVDYTPSHHEAGYYTTVETWRKNDSYTSNFNVSKTSRENNTLKIKVRFLREPHYGEGSLLLEKIIDLNTQVENGNNYKITGKLGNIAEVGNGELNVSLTPFNEDEAIDIPFE